MTLDAAEILAALDRACDVYEFPMLDNGYVYLAATRLTLHRSETDWAVVTEVFGFSPRGETPFTSVCTVASRLRNRKQPSDFHPGWYETYLRRHPNLEQRHDFPIDDEAWQDADDLELIREGLDRLSVRGRVVTLPAPDAYDNFGIVLEKPPRVQTFELCRFLAEVAREDVLATPDARRHNVPDDISQILQLDEWHHPDLAAGERPSGLESFRQMAEVLVTGDVDRYRTSRVPNTHWRHWPDGGRL
jgi:hypothetical protein